MVVSPGYKDGSDCYVCNRARKSANDSGDGLCDSVVTAIVKKNWGRRSYFPTGYGPSCADLGKHTDHHQMPS